MRRRWVPIGASRAASVGRLEHRPHVVERHVEVAQAADQLSGGDLVGRVEAVAVGGVDRRRREQADVVVVVQGLHAQVGHAGELAHGERHVGSGRGCVGRMGGCHTDSFAPPPTGGSSPSAVPRARPSQSDSGRSSAAAARRRPGRGPGARSPRSRAARRPPPELPHRCLRRHRRQRQHRDREHDEAAARAPRPTPGRGRTPSSRRTAPRPRRARRPPRPPARARDGARSPPARPRRR